MVSVPYDSEWRLGHGSKYPPAGVPGAHGPTRRIARQGRRAGQPGVAARLARAGPRPATRCRGRRRTRRHPVSVYRVGAGPPRGVHRRARILPGRYAQPRRAGRPVAGQQHPAPRDRLPPARYRLPAVAGGHPLDPRRDDRGAARPNRGLLGHPPVTPARPSPWVNFLRWIFSRRPAARTAAHADSST